VATVSGWTRINACFHPGQSRRDITQNNLSEAANRGCRYRTFKTASLPDGQIFQKQIAAGTIKTSSQNRQKADVA
jgi:hypothetical protein